MASIHRRTKTMSEEIADYIVGARFEDLPPAVVQKAKAQIVYHFGLAFAGSFNEEARPMREVLRGSRQPVGGATVIAERFRLPPSEAAFANTTLMRAIWRDDVLFPSGIHAGIVTLPTALAIGEVKRVSGREMLMALVLGYEVLGKLGNAADGWASSLPRRPTMIFGGYGPVTVAGRLLKLDRQRMANGLGYAAHLGMGVPEGGQMDHFYSLISRNGTFAAQLAKAGGVPGSRATIEGELGLYRSYFGEVPAGLPRLIDSLGSDWEILKAEYKRHHGTGQSTVAIELLLDLVRKHKLTADQAVKIDVFLPSTEQGRKEHFSRGPFKTSGDAYSSLPYALALVLVDGKVTAEQYTHDAIDATVNGVMQKINVIFEDREVARYCRLEVHTADGRKAVGVSDHFMFPFPPSDWGEWLQEDGKRLLPLKNLRRLEQLIVDLEKLDDVSGLMATVVPTSAPM